MDMSGFQKRVIYEQIKTYVLEHTGLKVAGLYISQVKRKCGPDVCGLSSPSQRIPNGSGTRRRRKKQSKKR